MVLVVDDDPAVLSSLEFALQTEGFSVTTFASGHDLLEREQMPVRGCVVIDYYLPGMNGLEVAIALRERGIELPIILITTHPTRDAAPERRQRKASRSSKSRCSATP